MDKLTLDEINYLRGKHKDPGLKLATASGLQGEITGSERIISILLDMAEESLKEQKYTMHDIPDQMKEDFLVAVPLKPTFKMVEAGANLPATQDWEQAIHDIYSAMVEEYINPTSPEGGK